MTKISHKRSSRRISAPALLVGLIVFLLVGSVFFWRQVLADFFWRVASPAVLFRNNLKINGEVELRAELASTTAALADRNVLLKENTELKARLRRTDPRTVVLAGILQRPPGIPYDTFIVDVGSDAGVVAGDRVSAGGSTVIGEITDVYAHTSRVVLLSAPGHSYSALLTTSKGSGAIPVTMTGQGGGSLVGQVPAGTDIIAGDSIIFPGVFGGFIGEVSHVDYMTGESFITLYTHLPVDPLELRYVEIWKYEQQ